LDLNILLRFKHINMKNIILLSIWLSFYCISQAQVQIKRHTEPTISAKGIFGKSNLEKK